MNHDATTRVDAKSRSRRFRRMIGASLLATLGTAVVSLPHRVWAYSCSAPTFTAHTDYATASASGSVVVGTFNAGSAPDLVTNTSILLGDGAGGFGAANNLETPFNYTGSGAPLFVAADDFDHDGNLDIASVDYAGNLWVLLGNGNGTFAPAVSYPTAAGNFFAAVGDLDHDGNKDLVLVNGAQISVLLGNSDGSFDTPTVTTLAAGALGVAVADLDGDTQEDLVVADGSSNTVSVLLGNGDGTFGSPTSIAVGGSPFFVALADLDGDTKFDLVVVNSSGGNVAVLRGDGNGGFGPPTTYTVGSQPTSVAIQDLNGDLKPDLVVANSNSSSVSMLLNDGAGGFDPAVSLAVGNQPIFVTLDDLNGDGRPDIVVSSATSSTLSVLLNACGYPVHDTVVLPVKPVSVTIPAGKSSVTKSITVKVRNADQTATAGYLVNLAVDDSDCGAVGATAATPDFLPLSAGVQDTIQIADGKTKSAKVVLTISSGAFTSFNRKAPHRCTLWFTSSAQTALLNADPTLANNSFPVELNVIDLNDPDQTAVHETTLDSLKPITINIAKGMSSKTSTVLPKVGNADANEPLGDIISAVASDGTCPTGTVGAIDFSTLSGVQSSATVKGQFKKSGRLPVTANSTLCTPNNLSPQRCIATVTATGPGGDSDASNNTTRLVIDMVDKNDSPGSCVP